ncbi:MAG: YggS family pyridoxal phosphate-dependent enzyme [Xanthomonadales bacterium]
MNNLKENLENIRARVETACETAGRAASEVEILAVSKRHPTAKIRAMHALGHTRFGENYIQEALPKIAELADLGLEWHYIGPLQSNKTKEAATHFQWVQSADRPKILRRLSSQRPAELPPLNVCIQVNIDREPQKAGVAPEETGALARLCQELPRLRLRGLMCIPRIGSSAFDPADSYARMCALYRTLCDEGLPLDTLSMGMSADLEAAVLHGSTMIRIGTDLFGPRPAAEA